ncbi:MAG TPA: hypothetical protein ENJ18_14615 [Nannocystis exedens]|nr:hypothetical protein [Nannocystis exedens]
MRTCAPSVSLLIGGFAALVVALSACSRGDAGRSKKAKSEFVPERRGGAKVAKSPATPVATKITPESAKAPTKPVESAPSTAKGSLPAVNERAAAELAMALRSVEDDSAAVVAAAGLAELEADRLPGFLTSALREYAAVPPAERSKVVSHEIGGVEGQAAWGQACKAGVIVFQEVATADPGDKSRILFERCDLGRFGIFDAKAANSADPAALLMAVIAAEELSRDGSLSESEGFAIGKLGTRPGSDDAEEP